MNEGLWKISRIAGTVMLIAVAAVFLWVGIDMGMHPSYEYDMDNPTGHTLHVEIDTFRLQINPYEFVSGFPIPEGSPHFKVTDESGAVHWDTTFETRNTSFERSDWFLNLARQPYVIEDRTFGDDAKREPDWKTVTIEGDNYTGNFRQVSRNRLLVDVTEYDYGIAEIFPIGASLDDFEDSKTLSKMYRLQDFRVAYWMDVGDPGKPLPDHIPKTVIDYSPFSGKIYRVSEFSLFTEDSLVFKYDPGAEVPADFAARYPVVPVNN